MATGFESNQGFVVKGGSQAAGETAPSYPSSVAKFREELIANGVLAKSAEAYVFTQDYVFTSPSYAADIVLGRNANGRTEWKDAKGRTLKDIQMSEAS